MKRFIMAVMVLLMLCVALTGCDSWMNGSYSSVTPHQDDSVQVGQEVINVSSYAQLRDSLESLVEVGADGGVFTLPGSNNATAQFYMQTAVNSITKNNPIGAYALNSITYEIGTNRGEPVVAFQMSYHKDRYQILRIQRLENVEEGKLAIASALDQCESSVVMLVKKYEETDLLQFVQNYIREHPDSVIEMPVVQASVYPEKGEERVVELAFAYKTDTETLKKMQAAVNTVFTAAELYVKETKDIRVSYEKLFYFLKDYNDYSIQTSSTPAYSLLLEGFGDSQAFAEVYSAMCRRAGLDCKIVNGTKNGQPHSWNLVRYRGRYQHVDMMESEFLMRPDEDMVGYQWDAIT